MAEPMEVAQSSDNMDVAVQDRLITVQLVTPDGQVVSQTTLNEKTVAKSTTWKSFIDLMDMNDEVPVIRVVTTDIIPEFEVQEGEAYYPVPVEQVVNLFNSLIKFLEWTQSSAGVAYLEEWGKLIPLDKRDKPLEGYFKEYFSDFCGFVMDRNAERHHKLIALMQMSLFLYRLDYTLYYDLEDSRKNYPLFHLYMKGVAHELADLCDGKLSGLAKVFRDTRLTDGTTVPPQAMAWLEKRYLWLQKDYNSDDWLKKNEDLLKAAFVPPEKPEDYPQCHVSEERYWLKQFPEPPSGHDTEAESDDPLCILFDFLIPLEDRFK